MNTIRLSDFPAYVAQSPAIPVDKDRSEVRVYSTIITAATIYSLLRSALYLGMSTTTMHKAADSVGGAVWWTSAFLLAAALILPHLAALVFMPRTLAATWPRKMAAGSMVFAGILCALLANAAKDMASVGVIPLTYFVSGVGYLLVGGAYGYSLNAQQAKQLLLSDEVESETR